MKLRDENGVEYEVSGIANAESVLDITPRPTVVPCSTHRLCIHVGDLIVSRVPPPPEPDDVDRLVEELFTDHAGMPVESLVKTDERNHRHGYLTRRDVAKHIRSLLARQTERQRADEALADYLVERGASATYGMKIVPGGTGDGLVAACRAARAALGGEAGK